MSFRWPDAPVDIRVRPLALANARRKVEASAGDAVPAQDLLAPLRKRLQRGLMAPERYSRRELRLVAFLVPDREVGARSLQVLVSEVHRLSDRGLASLLAYAPQEQAVGEECRRRRVERVLRGPRWFRVLNRDDTRSVGAISKRIVQSYGRMATTLPGLLERTDMHLDAPLTAQVLERWLEAATLQQLARRLEDHLAFVRQRDAPSRVAALLADKLLRAVLKLASGGLSDGSPAVAVLRALHSRYGGWPETTTSRARWKHQSEQTRELARRWRIQQSLEDFFGKLHGDPDRLKYWRRWMRHIMDVKHFREVSGFMIHIGDVYIVEFGRVGNAAYIYPRSAWASLSRVKPTVPKDLKNTTRCLHRIIHTPGWEPRADDWMIRQTRLRPDG